MRGWATVTLLPRIVVSLSPSPAAKLLSANPLQQNVEPSYGVCLEVPSKRGTPKSWVSMLTCSTVIFVLGTPILGNHHVANHAILIELLSSFCSQQTTAPKAGHSPSVPDAFQLFFMISVEKPRVGKATRSTPEIKYVHIVIYIHDLFQVSLIYISGNTKR